MRTLLLFLQAVLLALIVGFIPYKLPANNTNDLFTFVYKSSGIFSVKREADSLLSTLTLHNVSGSIYATINFDNNTIRINKELINFNKRAPDTDSLSKKYDFSPLYFYPEYHMASFCVKEKVGNKVFVYVNKKKTSVKYILVSDMSQVSVQTWREHLLNSDNYEKLEIGFKQLANPLLVKPNSKLGVKINNKQAEDTSWRIKRFQGYWAEIESFDGCGENKPNKPYRGWVRWTDGKRPLLSLFYDC